MTTFTARFSTIATLIVLSLAGCSSSPEVRCGEGTTEVDGTCVSIAADASQPDGDAIPVADTQGADQDAVGSDSGVTDTWVLPPDAADAGSDAPAWSADPCPSTSALVVCSSDCGGKVPRCSDYISCPGLSKYPLIADRPTSLRLPGYSDAPTCASCGSGTQMRGIYLAVSASAPFIAQIAPPWRVFSDSSPSCSLSSVTKTCIKTGFAEVNMLVFTTDPTAPPRNLLITPITSSTDSCP